MDHSGSLWSIMAHVCAHGSLWIIKTPVPIILTHYLDPHFLLWTIWKCWLERSKGAMGIHTPQWWVKPKSYEYTVWWHSILSPFCWVRPIIAQFLLLQSQPQAMGSRFDVLLAPDDELDVKQASTWSLDFFWEISLDKYGKSMENQWKIAVSFIFLRRDYVGQYAEMLCQTKEMMVDTPKRLGRLKSLPASYIPTVEPNSLFSCLEHHCITSMRFQRTHHRTPKQAASNSFDSTVQTRCISVILP